MPEAQTGPPSGRPVFSVMSACCTCLTLRSETSILLHLLNC